LTVRGAPLVAAMRASLLTHCTAVREDSLAGIETELAGPTGERNTLSFHGRGKVMLVAADATTILSQIAAVWATENQAVLPGNELSRSVHAMLPADLAAEVEIRGRADEWDAPDIAAVLFMGSAADAAAIRARLAKRSGPIVPLIAVEAGRYPLERLVVEKSVSVNTAAAGGNATLMRLE
jgi:RHH-type proline utilization regulon transcriptional repressor/proline dehydrogenase/delta 1-pyrroline-5-carboxylate dehydrogenase